jgi:hypothetical protein
MDIPVFVKNRFPDFYKAMFSEQVRKEDMRTVFTEYAWDMGFCDPCSAEPLSPPELAQLGARTQGPMPFLTRLHLRYDNAHFPEDLVFQETGDRTNFQGRYVLRHAWTGADTCPAAIQYRHEVPQRLENEARTLALLTGWSIDDIRRQMR